MPLVELFPKTLRSNFKLAAITGYMLGAIIGQAQPPGNSDFYSRSNGSYSTHGTWSTDSHNGNSCNCSPGCNLTGTGDIFIAHKITSNCDPFTLKGNRKIYLSNGARLSISGDVEISSNTQLEISPGDTCTINGNLTVKGNGSMAVDGFLQVTGDVTTSGNGSVCGTGMTEVGGSISGSGWCMGLSVLPVELLYFRSKLNGQQEVELEWATATENNNSHFLLEKSHDGISFEKVAQLEGAVHSQEEIIYRHTDAQPFLGTSYYRLTQFDFDGKYEVFDILAIQIEDNTEGICDLKVIPNPCVPSCKAVLTDCTDQQIRAEILDAGGNYIQQIIPVKAGSGQYTFHLNENNLLAPGMYIISAATQSSRLSEKILVK